MAYGPPDAPFHVIGSRTFPVPADRAMLETLLSELESREHVLGIRCQH